MGNSTGALTMEIPETGVSVLASITHQTCLGLCGWYEVVYHDGDNWKSYQDSKTFNDGEQVGVWIYASQCLPI